MKTLTKDTAIALLMGGPGSERQVSLVSGNAVLTALKEEGFTNVTPVIVERERPTIPAGTELCYNMIHGTYGEDGGLQSYLEELGIPYTGAGAATSRNCFDKILTKKAFFAAGVPTPADEVINPGEMPTIGVPCVIKPPCEGSSVGVSIVKTEEELPAAVSEAAKYGTDLLVEEYIEGKELTVAIFNGTALPVIHIAPREGFYDYANKYPSLSGGVGSDYICPADITEEETKAVQEAALAAYKALNVEVYGRVDVLLTKDSKPYVLEINTIPGMTSASLFPKAAAAVGISFGELCRRIAEISLNQPRG
ncbi:MAG: D-alanine--D-alanine ligase [Akkermansiaceae bacterium]|nr:D-alanine--D-alanine ligase [Akkermansiaceae bacterium]